MEKIRQKRYKIASSNVDRSYGERYSPVKRSLRGGNGKNDKQRNLPMLASESSSCSSGVTVTDEDSFTLELGWRFSKEAFGTPVKKLLADEMSKETEMKKRSPSVIAKLMGLDGLPSPRSAGYNQQKCPSENYSQSKEKVVRRDKHCYGQISRRSSKDQGEFKDVFEVSESSKKQQQSRNSDQGNSKLKGSKSEMAFIQQKFMDDKRLSIDQKSHNSREFQDALDALETNRDLLLKFLHQPGSLFSRHLQDSGSHSGRGRSVPATESSDNRKCDYSDIRGKSERGTQKNSGPSDSTFLGRSSKSTQRANELEHLPTRIVVLKPNVGKLQNASNGTFPARSLQEYSDLGEFRIAEKRNKEHHGNKKSRDKEVLPRHSFKESDVTNGITRQKINGVFTPPVNLKCPGFQGYAGDESSCSFSETESAEESVARKVSLKTSSNLNLGHRRKAYRRKESSISREAKKRLNDRLKLTRKADDEGIVSRGSTLADMLAAHDNAVMGSPVEGFEDTFPNDQVPATEVEPLGISSKDGWKDKFDSRERLLGQKSKTSKVKSECLESNGQIQVNQNRIKTNLDTSYFNVDDRNQIPQIVEDERNPYTVTIPESPEDLQLEFSDYVSTVSGDQENLLTEEGPSENNSVVAAIKSPARASSKDADQPSPVSVLEPAAAFRDDDLSSSSECFESVSADLQGLRMQLHLLKLESEEYAEGPRYMSRDEEPTEGPAHPINATTFDDNSQLGASDNWESSYLFDVLINSGLNDGNLDISKPKWHSSDHPINPMTFEELEKTKNYPTSTTRCDRKLLFDRIDSGIVAIGRESNDHPLPWVKTKPSKTRISRMWKSEDGLRNKLCKFLETEEKRINREGTEEECDWEDLREEIDVIGKEIENLMIEQVLDEVVKMIQFG